MKTDFEKVYFPKSIVQIGESAFASCIYLKNINFPEGLTGIGDYAFIGCKKLERICLPRSLKIIGMHAFIDTGIKNVIIPEKITILRKWVFCGCTCLEKVILNEAFSDLAVRGNFTTNEDYMPFIHSLQQGAENTRTGYLNVSVLGGNTANTEFEFLTGNPKDNTNDNTCTADYNSGNNNC